MFGPGNPNFFTSEYVIGTTFPKDFNLDEVKMLKSWLEFKDKDWGMKNYRTAETQCIVILHHIDLDTLREILHDLIPIYNKKYPYSEKSDFIKHVFGETLISLENFIGRNFTYYGSSNESSGYICFYYNDKYKYPIIDYILEQSKDVDFYKQYYSSVIELIQSIDYNTIVSNISATHEYSKEEVNKLKIPEIALIHVYEGIPITRHNSSEIAAKYGYTANNSGEGLFQDYTYYKSSANRKGKPNPFSQRKLLNKIRLLESVTTRLTINALTRARDEIKILKTLFDSEF
ncbi:MAG: hypothetical protein IPL31_17585 [Saprospiraceae bacterium]|nr:hypothetical protein [Saprospiraceae bacterium]